MEKGKLCVWVGKDFALIKKHPDESLKTSFNNDREFGMERRQVKKNDSVCGGLKKKEMTKITRGYGYAICSIAIRTEHKICF